MAISVGSVEVDVIPNTKGIYARLKEQLVPAATRAGADAGSSAGNAFGPAMQAKIGDIGLSIGEQIGRQIASRIKPAVQDAFRDGVTVGGQRARPAATRQGEETGGAFARAIKGRLEAAFKSLPKADVGLNDTGVDADLARLRAKLETLAGKRVGIDIDVATADALIADVEARLDRLGAAHPNVAVRVDTAAARAQLIALREDINRVTAEPAVVRVETEGSFGRRLRAAVEAAQASLPQISIDANTTPAEVELAFLRRQLAELGNQRVGIDIDAATATARIEEIRARLRVLVESTASVDVRIDAAGAEAKLAAIAALVDSLDTQTVTIGPEPAAAARDGEETGGAFARALKARLDVAFKTLPKLDVRLSDTGVDADLARLRARLETLASKRIGVDIDVATADAQIADMEQRLLRLGAAHPDIAVRADTVAARAQLTAMREDLARLAANPTHIRVETDGSFGAKLRAQVTAAQASLPDVNIHTRVDTTPADLEIARLRAALGSLSEQRIGIDISAAEATAKIDEIKAKLERLSASNADVNVRVDAAAAAAQLAAVQGLVSGLDGETAKVNVDVSGALSAIFQLTVALGSVAVIPAIPILGAGLGALTAASVAAGAGLGAFAAVALPALSSIKGALDSQKQAQDAATTASAKGAQGNAQAASRALQMAGAQQALASAERNGARQIAQAQAQVVQAKRAVGDAVEQAALRQQQAARAVNDAEKQLGQAQKDARQAQLDLTAARKQAGQELEDLNNQLKDGALSQREAVLAVQRAKEQLDATNAAGSTASVLQRQEAQLAYDQAKQALVDQSVRQKRLQEQTAAANKVGIKGSQTYLSAQDKVAQAQQNVTDRTQGLRDAQAEYGRVQVQNARAISDAQQKVADAMANVAQAQASAADSISSAQRQIASSSASAAGGVDAAATAQAKYQAQLAKLSPSARGTFNAFVSLRSAFKAWSEALQPAVMPIFTRALNGLRNSLPGLTPFVLSAAKALTILQDRVSAGFRSPWWLSFRTSLAGAVVPAIVGLGAAVGRIFKGLGGIVDAFLPHMDEISARMQKVTGRFANWGTSLKGSPAFEHFLDYAATQGPLLASALGKIGRAFLDVSQSLAPLSGPVLTVFGVLADGISKIATTAPGVIQLIYGIYVVTRLATLATVAYTVILAAWKAATILVTLVTEGWTAAVWASNAAFEANPVVALVTIIIAAIVLLVLAVIYAYNHFTWFRVAVQATWAAIQTAALWAWNNVLKPIFNALAVVVMWIYNNVIKLYFAAIVLYFHILADVAMWLWRNILAPVFSGIGSLVSAWWFGVKVYFALVWEALKFVGAGATWLWQHSLGPAFAEMGRLIGLWWAGVKLYAGFVISIFRAIGAGAMWLWDHGISPAFGWIADKATWVWTHGIKPAFDSIKWAIGKVSEAFGTAKDEIGKAWDQISSLAAKPIRFIVDHVYNQGIVPLWNKVAGLVDDKHNLSPLNLSGFATGGVIPGYTPGRDNSVIAVGGGEAIMRPEWTRAVGPSYVHSMNAAARSGGVGGVQSALGMPGFSDGGIFGNAWSSIKHVGSTVKNAAGSVINGAEQAAQFLTNPDKVFEVAGNWVRAQMKGFASSQWGQTVTKIPLSMLRSLKDQIFGGGSGEAAGSLGVMRALAWARTQVGKPYQWGGGGDPSYDCCIVGPVRVYGPNGAVPIKDVRAGDHVFSYVNGKVTTQTVTAAWQSKTQQVYKVRTRNRAVTASANHPFMRLVQVEPSRHVKGGKRGEQVPARYDTEWVRLDELQRGDLLVQPRAMDVDVDRTPTLPDGTPITVDVAWLLGLFIGDGCLTDSDVRICVYGATADRAQRVFRQLGSNSATYVKHGVIASSTALARMLADMGLRTPGPDKRVPECVWTWGTELRQAFLDGYCDADGHHPTDPARHGERTYASASRELLEDVRALHIMLGQPVSNISTNLRIKPITIKGVLVKNARPLHTFTVWPGEGRGEVAIRRHSAGLAAWLDSGDFTVARVLEVSDEGVQDTYDLEVEGAHNFIADGVVVHNSGFMAAIQKEILGQNPIGRLWSTFSFQGDTAPAGWKRNMPSPFMIGVTNDGVGHTAGTLAGVNVESRGGTGIHVGATARGATDSLFQNIYGFMPARGALGYDSGGWLPPGLNLAYNGTGRPEPIFTSQQANGLMRLASTPGSSGGEFTGNLYLDSGELLGMVRGEVHQNMAGLTAALGAGRG